MNATQVKLRGILGSALLTGGIFGASARHVLHALVGLPSWLLLLTALSLAAVIMRSASKTAAVAAIGSGALLAFSVPEALPSPSEAVVTHAASWARGVDLFDALAKLDEDPDSLLGKRILVSGLWRSADGLQPPAVYRSVMACCAADAVDVGFDVQPVHPTRIGAGSYVTVSGIPVLTVKSGETRFELREAEVSVRNTVAK